MRWDIVKNELYAVSGEGEKEETKKNIFDKEEVKIDTAYRKLGDFRAEEERGGETKKKTSEYTLERKTRERQWWCTYANAIRENGNGWGGGE